MKKIAITCALLTSFVASSVWADAASDLKSRLDKVSSFHASFTQKVTAGRSAQQLSAEIPAERGG
jgi:outer membrane lipoprotein carrier protein